MINDCVCYQNPHDGSNINDREVQKKTQNSYIFLHNNDCKTPYIDIYIDFLSINFNLLSILLH